MRSSKMIFFFENVKNNIITVTTTYKHGTVVEVLLHIIKNVLEIHLTIYFLFSNIE